ncbi:hypothetical protein LOC68_12685 [Blastopirellula sp. JC732]|uniref:Uncharacterized protein n=1 Tax=Blastopirellula sediminis TaxID=2894196 RepID=A0A9X1MMY9_9BACT|nr:hypothetical protein [Blastopirellula sediminis]MCC9607455.1 hypothetical protein [Blastopirellula sediminis]MCC9629252.1 hypothetical protein [Blastopirellula sediminis]
MSPQSSGNPPKQKVNIYSMMLILSFIALLIGAILMYMELSRFGTFPQWKVSQAAPAISVALPAAGPSALG